MINFIYGTMLGFFLGVFSVTFTTWFYFRKNTYDKDKIRCTDSIGERNLYCYNCVYDSQCPFEKGKK